MSLEPQDRLRQKLEQETQEITFDALNEHLERGALFIVAPTLDLIDIGEAMALDKVAEVRGWLNSGELKRVVTEDTADLNPEGENFLFRFLIISPYVLIQKIVKEEEE